MKRPDTHAVRRFMVLMLIDGNTYCLSMHRTKASADTRMRQHRRYVYPVGRYSFTVKELGVD